MNKLLLLSLLCFPFVAEAAKKTKTAACEDSKLIYKVCSDQSKIFGKQLAQAKKNNKKLLVVLGADWCPWCVSLNRILHVEEFWKDLPGFELAEIGVYKGEDRFPSGDKVLARIMEAAGEKAKPKGVPILAVYNPNTSQARFIDTEPLEKNTSVSKGHDPEKLVKAIQQAAAQTE